MLQNRASICDVMFMSYVNCVGMVKHLTGGYKVTYHPTEDEELILDFTPPFKKVSLISELEKVLKVKFPPAESLDTEGCHKRIC